MTENEKSNIRGFDCPNRSELFTDTVYSGEKYSRSEAYEILNREKHSKTPQKSEYNIYFGDLHGHSRLSDGSAEPEAVIKNCRDVANLDFCALTDHDHGGVGKAELWSYVEAFGMSKFDYIKKLSDKYYLPESFTTVIGYERDSYPYYTNMVIYFKDNTAKIFRSERDGELTRYELMSLIKDDSLVFGPHTSAMPECGTYFPNKAPDEMPSFFEIYSRSGCYEYYGAPFPPKNGTSGGYLQDALENGARCAVIANTDDHNAKMGLIDESAASRHKYPGITAVLAKQNTREAIFEALKARRSYAFMGPEKIFLDFRINGHYMGEEFDGNGKRREIYFKIDSEAKLSKVEIIKNAKSVMFFHDSNEECVFDSIFERKTDYYYLRAELCDGRLLWSSPIFVNN